MMQVLNDNDLDCVAGGFVLGVIMDTVSGGAMSNGRASSAGPSLNDNRRRGGDTGRVVNIDLRTSGGGYIDLGSKRDIFPRHRGW